VRLAIMQPYLFPYLGYFQLVHAADKFVFADDYTFIKGGWINRNRLLINNEPAYFTVPLKHVTSTTLIREAEIDDSLGSSWRRPLLKTIENYYRRTPQFSAVFPLVEQVLTEPTTSIAGMARASVVRVAEFLGLPTAFVPTMTGYGNAQLKGQDRVIDTCLREGADHYVNAIGGRELYSREAFAARGIRLGFVESDSTIEYAQFRGPFTPGLSIIDVLMFNARDEARALVGRYQLL
jgi:hypothetical protein